MKSIYLTVIGVLFFAIQMMAMPVQTANPETEIATKQKPTFKERIVHKILKKRIKKIQKHSIDYFVFGWSDTFFIIYTFIGCNRDYFGCNCTQSNEERPQSKQEKNVCHYRSCVGYYRSSNYFNNDYHRLYRFITMRKLLLTGVSGFLGRHILRYPQNDWQILGTYYENKPQESGDFHQINLTQKGRVEALFEMLKPDAVIHTAASLCTDCYAM